MPDDIPQSDERSVAIRLRDHEQCQVCHRGSDKVRLEIHQIVPGETSQMSNFILLCAKHHEAAHSRNNEQFEQYGA